MLVAEDDRRPAKIEEPATSGESGIAKAVAKALPWAKLAADAALSSPKLRHSPAGIALGIVKSLLDGFVDSVSTGQNGIVIEAVEDIVYLDDSGSMSGSGLAMAQDLWRDMAQRLQGNPTRILKFGTTSHLLVPRSKEFSSTAVSLNWNASSGSTYMWHMILNDMLLNYVPGSGLLRVFVITDGGDTDSPSPYRGMQGMDPMMRELKSKGYDIEFHIVFVSVPSFSQILFQGLNSKDLGRYRDFALATGGSFLHLSKFAQTEERDAFLRRMESYDDKDIQKVRVAARQQYEDRLLKGQATDFAWYERLPPPSKR